METKVNITEKLNQIKKTIEDESFNSIDNIKRRQLYVELELLKLQIENELKLNPPLDGASFSNIITEIISLQSKLKLKHVFQRKTIFTRIDEVIRFIAVWLCLITSALLLVLPCLIFMPFEGFINKYILRLKKKYYIASIIKVWIGNYVLLVSGIAHRVQYEVNPDEIFAQKSIVCFSHGSTMDAFIITSSIRPTNYTLAKDDLFLIPFFNLMLLAFNGIPVVRSNLDKAKESLQFVQDTLEDGECISIAPEGTRSKTGHLLEFKKGAFHMWEHLKIPIIPVVIFGAYELFPSGSQMSVPGNVVVQILKPIQPNEASSRQDMSILLRKRMCAAIAKCPPDAAMNLTGNQRVKYQQAVAILFAVDYICWRVLRDIIVGYLGISWKWLGIGFSLFTVLSIISVYTYAVYIRPAITKALKKTHLKSI